MQFSGQGMISALSCAAAVAGRRDHQGGSRPRHHLVRHRTAILTRHKAFVRLMLFAVRPSGLHTRRRRRADSAYPSPIAQFENAAPLRGAFSAVVRTLRERGFVSMFVRLHPI
jgi:hypothetical protein